MWWRQNFLIHLKSTVLMKEFACLLISLSTFISALAQLQPIGSWREHLPYHQAIATAISNNEVFSATRFSIFSIEPAHNSLHRFSKINGLSEKGVSCIG